MQSRLPRPRRTTLRKRYADSAWRPPLDQPELAFSPAIPEIRTQRLIRSGRGVRIALAIALSCWLWLLGPTDASALIFGSPKSEPEDVRPNDFPYWDNISQRRYEGPTVIYLGAGWALTARHVGVGEIFLEGKFFTPIIRSRHTLMNVNGTAADVIVFQLDPVQTRPDLPMIPLASTPPLRGEQVMIIGFGHVREKVIRWRDDYDARTRFGFEWSSKTGKRWGTNRITSPRRLLVQKKRITHTFTLSFDPPNSEQTTRHEAQAAVGDSGGAVFVERDGKWLLAGMMTSISAHASTPARTATYGDVTYAADISTYRDEILRWARPECANEMDDDGDGKTDFPLDPDCDSPEDPDERGRLRFALPSKIGWGVVSIASSVLAFGTLAHYRSRKRS